VRLQEKEAGIEKGVGKRRLKAQENLVRREGFFAHRVREVFLAGLVQRLGSILVQHRQVEERLGILGDQAAERHENLLCHVQVAVARLEDSRIRQLGENIGLDGENEAAVIGGMFVIGIVGQEAKHARYQHFPAELIEGFKHRRVFAQFDREEDFRLNLKIADLARHGIRYANKNYIARQAPFSLRIH